MIYHIYSARSGADLGTYEAFSARGALDALARDAGYPNYAAVAADFDGALVAVAAEED